ncbi:uncharacterized protein LOC119687760 [Teleopsis dalmanni]|uniref:uncharacterized protein LOC119672577 n=1 Tax=Teleopsis dalmanni TaxID=139649 RepID=UPI0018CCA163|nr:uncharacterized protein LOC119672577 [Teleopsis dalmanni]XP_037958145.1 uncharacterized protein LOC119687760 [Teleopsis dalmanni]
MGLLFISNYTYGCQIAALSGDPFRMNKSNKNFNKPPKTPNPSGGRSSLTRQAPINNQPSRASAQAVRTCNAPSLNTLATVPGGNAASCSSASAAVKANTPTAPSAISTNSTSGTRSHPNPSTRAYRARRSAYRILSRLNAVDPSSLSESDKASLKWARENVNLRPSDIASTSTPAHKRQRSIEQAGKSILTSAPKRPKFGPPRLPSLSKPLSEIVKESLTWAIINAGSSDGTISPANWKKVERALLKIYMEIIALNPGPSPSCKDAGWYQGHIKIIACSD